MCNMWIIGGTTEGRLLAEYCHQCRIPVFVSVASEYGGSLLKKSQYLTVTEERLDAAQMENFILKHDVSYVFDASHPYASLVSEHTRTACERRHIDYIRVVRASGTIEDSEGIIWVKDAIEAAEYLRHTKGTIFLSTGSKELPLYTAAVEEFEERFYVRVLPDPGVLSQCRDLGLPMKHVIAMQGPFSREINREMFLHAGARILVTKEAGGAGGFEEKLFAAKDCGMDTVIVGRPQDVDGVSLKQAKEIISEHAGITNRSLYLIGTGMGGAGQLTLEAEQAIKNCQAVLGAPRVLESVKELTANKLTAPVYLPKQVEEWLDEHKDIFFAALLFSGDTGFYSGCKGMTEIFKSWENFSLTVLPGISSLSYFCAKLGLCWEDAAVLSLHGRDGDLESMLTNCDKIFVLLGGERSVAILCQRLLRAGCGEWIMHVGERLSYVDERITTGTVRELSQIGRSFDTLCVALLEMK